MRWQILAAMTCKIVPHHPHLLPSLHGTNGGSSVLPVIPMKGMSCSAPVAAMLSPQSHPWPVHAPEWPTPPAQPPLRLQHPHMRAAAGPGGRCQRGVPHPPPRGADSLPRGPGGSCRQPRARGQRAGQAGDQVAGHAGGHGPPADAADHRPRHRRQGGCCAPARAHALLDWPAPSDQQDLRCFLGLSQCLLISALCRTRQLFAQSCYRGRLHQCRPLQQHT